MTHAMFRASEEVISDILNWVCPECGGQMGGRTQEFKCQGQCRKDWRAVWESRLAKPEKNTNLPQALTEKVDSAKDCLGRQKICVGRRFRGERLTLRPVARSAARAM
jgi:hypothetical protein